MREERASVQQQRKSLVGHLGRPPSVHALASWWRLARQSRRPSYFFSLSRACIACVQRCALCSSLRPPHISRTFVTSLALFIYIMVSMVVVCISRPCCHNAFFIILSYIHTRADSCASRIVFRPSFHPTHAQNPAIPFPLILHPAISISRSFRSIYLSFVRVRIPSAPFSLSLSHRRRDDACARTSPFVSRSRKRDLSTWNFPPTPALHDRYAISTHVFSLPPTARARSIAQLGKASISFPHLFIFAVCIEEARTPDVYISRIVNAVL